MRNSSLDSDWLLLFFYFLRKDRKCFIAVRCVFSFFFFFFVKSPTRSLSRQISLTPPPERWKRRQKKTKEKENEEKEKKRTRKCGDNDERRGRLLFCGSVFFSFFSFLFSGRPRDRPPRSSCVDVWRPGQDRSGFWVLFSWFRVWLSDHCTLNLNWEFLKWTRRRRRFDRHFGSFFFFNFDWFNGNQ